MKKYLLMTGAALCIASALTSCSDDKDKKDPEIPEVPAETIPSLSRDYFTIEGATFQTGAMPSAEDAPSLDDVSYNTKALSGGANFINVSTPDVMSEFYIGAAGVDGYYTVPAVPADRAGYTYQIPVLYSSSLASDVTMVLGGRDEDGNHFKPVRLDVEFVESFSGALEVNLVFENDKDIDLHLYTPSGRHIYYADRGFNIYENGEIVGRYGLDWDSNPGCSIDHLNNENIVIPAQYVENGVYKVVVNMFSNCNSSISTSWNLMVRYNDQFVTPLTGKNPASGVYPVGAGRGDFTSALTFEITGANGSAPTDADLSQIGSRSNSGMQLVKIPLDASAKAKFAD